MFNCTLYQYTCLPNRLSSAPRIFTKLLKPVFSTLHNKGHFISGYIDDSYLQGDTVEECQQNRTDTACLFTRLGFHIHSTKSVLIPSHILTFLGFILNSLKMTASPTQEKIQKTIGACSDLLNMVNPPIFEVVKVIGISMSNFPGVEPGPLHNCALEHDKTSAIAANAGNYEASLCYRFECFLVVGSLLSNQNTGMPENTTRIFISQERSNSTQDFTTNSH